MRVCFFFWHVCVYLCTMYACNVCMRCVCVRAQCVCVCALYV